MQNIPQFSGLLSCFGSAPAGFEQAARGDEFPADRDTVADAVPGGVGPMTVAMLLVNTYQACLARDGVAG